jgi:hypothetical protein
MFHSGENLVLFNRLLLGFLKSDIWGKCARMGNTLKIPSPTKLARLGHFPPASQAGRLAGPVLYVFSLVMAEDIHIG